MLSKAHGYDTPNQGMVKVGEYVAVVYLALGLFTATAVSAALLKARFVHLNPRYFDDGNGRGHLLDGRTHGEFSRAGASTAPVFDFNSY